MGITKQHCFSLLFSIQIVLICLPTHELRFFDLITLRLDCRRRYDFAVELACTLLSYEVGRPK